MTDMLATSFWIVILFVIPALILRAAGKYEILQKIGSISICYIIGIIISVLPFSFDKGTLELISSVALMVSIPLVLMGLNITAARKIAGKMLAAFALLVAAVVVVATSAFAILSRFEINGIEELMAMVTSTYIGGTPNLIMVGEALLTSDNREVTILCTSTIDILIGGTYLLPLLIGGKWFFNRILGSGRTETEIIRAEESDHMEKQRFSVAGLAGITGLSLILVCAGALIEYLVNGSLEGSLFIVVTVSLGGVILSLFRKVREVKGGYEFGNYLICVFAFGIAMCIDVSQITADMIPMVIIFAVCLPACILMHILFCRIFKIDGETALITSFAGVYGPQYVVVAAENFDLKDMAIPGVICGVLGFVLGNFIGILMGLVLMGI